MFASELVAKSTKMVSYNAIEASTYFTLGKA